MKDSRRIHRHLKTYLLAIAILVSVAIGFMNATENRTSMNVDGRTGSTSGSVKKNILLMGVDQRKHDVGRSDTLMLLTIDSGRKTATVTSIPRDSLVYVEGKGYSKINHAYGYGGPELVGKAVSRAMGVDIDAYAAINFPEFEKLIDSVGGVTVNVDKDLHYEDKAGDLHIDIKKGVRTLDGKTALGFVRFRHDRLNDFGRIKRQHELLTALISKLKSPKAMIRGLRTIEKTDISVKDLLGLMPLLHTKNGIGITFETAKGESKRLASGWYYILDSNAKEIARIFPPMQNSEQTAKSPDTRDFQISQDSSEGSSGITITPVSPDPTGIPIGYQAM